MLPISSCGWVSQEVEAGEYDRGIAAWYRAIEIYHALGDGVSAGIAYDYIGLTYAQLVDSTRRKTPCGGGSRSPKTTVIFSDKSMAGIIWAAS
jgi:tetratricopeptide (TPR) repeat protein